MDLAATKNDTMTLIRKQLDTEGFCFPLHYQWRN